MKIKIIPALLLISLLLMGCQSAVPDAVEVLETPAEEASEPEAYPSPTLRDFTQATRQTYPDPEGGVPTVTPVPYSEPTPGEDTGVVLGVAVDMESGEPLAYHTIYLAIRIPLTPGPGYTYGLQEKSSPHALTDEQGRFAIGNVEPGEYIVMDFHPESATVVFEANSDLELEVNVAPGETVDLGTIDVINPFP